MKKLSIALLLTLTWVMHSMEPELALETKLETMVERYLDEEARPSWVRLIDEALPSHNTIPQAQFGFRTSQVLAQEILRSKPQIKRFVLDKVTCPFKEYPGSIHASLLSVAFNQTGNKIITGARDGTARIWDSANGQPLLVLDNKKDYTASFWSTLFNKTSHPVDHVIFSAHFNQTGNKVVTASKTATKIWDTETGRPLLTIEGFVFSAAFNTSGDKVITGARDNTAGIWDADTGNPLLTFAGHTNHVNSAAFNSTGDKVVTASDDNTARIWDTGTGQLLFTLVGHNDKVTSAAFNSTGDKVATASWDGTARIWGAGTGNPLLTLDHNDKVTSAAFNSTGDKVATASWDGTVRIWDTETGRLLQALARKYRHDFFDSAMFNPAGDKIATASDDGTARIWDLEPFFISEKFLAEDITLAQIALLLDIFEAIKARNYLAARNNQAVKSRKPNMNTKGITFDFNKHPLHLWNEYVAMPEAIRTIFDPYITKPPSQEEIVKTNRTNYILITSALMLGITSWYFSKDKHSEKAKSTPPDQSADTNKEQEPSAENQKRIN